VNNLPRRGSSLPDGGHPQHFSKELQKWEEAFSNVVKKPVGTRQVFLRIARWGGKTCAGGQTNNKNYWGTFRPVESGMKDWKRRNHFSPGGGQHCLKDSGSARKKFEQWGGGRQCGIQAEGVMEEHLSKMNIAQRRRQKSGGRRKTYWWYRSLEKS